MVYTDRIQKNCEVVHEKRKEKLVQNITDFTAGIYKAKLLDQKLVRTIKIKDYNDFIIYVSTHKRKRKAMIRF